MGDVYRAKDTKLHREVALKVLPDSLVNDPDRVARFSREARVLASLNHSHIAQIHGLEESDRVRALVMDSSRVRRSPIGSRGRPSPWIVAFALARIGHWAQHALIPSAYLLLPINLVSFYFVPLFAAGILTVAVATARVSRSVIVAAVLVVASTVG